MPYVPSTHIQRQAAARLYASGLSSRQVAQLLGCAPQSVLRWSRMWDVPIREPARARSEVCPISGDEATREEVVTLYLIHGSYRAVSRITGLNRRTVTRIVERYRSMQ